LPKDLKITFKLSHQYLFSKTDFDCIVIDIQEMHKYIIANGHLNVQGFTTKMYEYIDSSFDRNVTKVKDNLRMESKPFRNLL